MARPQGGPQAVRSRPQSGGVTSRPQGVTSRPQGVRSRPVATSGRSRPQRMIPEWNPCDSEGTCGRGAAGGGAEGTPAQPPAKATLKVWHWKDISGQPWLAAMPRRMHRISSTSEVKRRGPPGKTSECCQPWTSQLLWLHWPCWQAAGHATAQQRRACHRANNRRSCKVGVVAVA